MTVLSPTMEPHPGRAKWLAARRSGLGGSDAPAALGLSRWRSPMEVWAEKVGLSVEDPDAETPLRLRLGNELEPIVAKILSEEAGVVVERTPWLIVRDAEHPELLCSPDGWATGDFNGRVLVELKTQDFARTDEWAEGVPEEYRVQVQHSLGVTGMPRAIVGALIGTRDFRWCWVERDEAQIAELRERLLDFWRLVVEETPPPPTGAEGDTRALSVLFPRPEVGRVIPLGADALDWTWDLRRLEEQSKALDFKKNELKNRIRAAIGDAEEGVLPGGEGSWRWRVEKRKAFTVAATENRILRAHKGGKA